jgi:hypothetical protein
VGVAYVHFYVLYSATYGFQHNGFESAFVIAPLLYRGVWGKMMRTLFTAANRGWKKALLPTLTFLTVTVFGLLSILVVLQDRTIDAQADVIHLAIKESRRLSVIAAQRAQQPTHSSRNKATGQVPSRQAEVQAPSTQVPLNKRTSEIPSSQQTQQARPGRKAHKWKRSPFSRPPAEVTDPSDMRRTLFSI